MKRALFYFGIGTIGILFCGVLFFGNTSALPDSPISPFDSNTCTASSGVVPEHVLALASLSVAEPEAIALIQELGVKYVRVEFRWDSIEPVAGEYQWEHSDDIVHQLRSRDIEIIATLNHPPVWSHKPEQLAPAFGDFLELFHQRYGEDIGIYEFFNEPNLPGYGWPFGTKNLAYDVELYASVLVAGNQALRKHDSNALILLAGLSPDNNPIDYFSQLAKFISADCYDIFSYHPYGQANRLVAVQSEWRQILQKENHVGKTVWMGEFGTSDDDIREDVLDAVSGQVAELDGLVWFSLRDLKQVGWNFGLVEYNWEKKPEFETFQEIVEQNRKVE